MADIRVQIPNSVLGGLQQRLDNNNSKPTEIVRDAITLYNWAVEEAAKGRILFTSDDKGEGVTRLAMPSLEAVKKS